MGNEFSIGSIGEDTTEAHGLGRTSTCNESASKILKVEQTSSGVRFGGVRVRKHAIILGDNPGGTANGPPITIDWDPMDESEAYSTCDSFSAKYPRHCVLGTAVRLSVQERRKIICEHYPEEEINKVEQEIQCIREERKESALEPEEGSVKAIVQNQKIGGRKAARKPRFRIRRLLRR